MAEELCAIAPNGLMGRIKWDLAKQELSFTYETEWRNRTDAYPLSLSMPLAAATHEHDKIEAFLWGLLPDNDGILKRWGGAL